MLLSREIKFFRQYGLKKTIRRSIQRRIGKFKAYRDAVSNKYGIEIGGPSSIFRDRGLIPLYKYVRSLDNCVFSSDTVWASDLRDDDPYRFHPDVAAGTNHVVDGSTLDSFGCGQYDFVLSSHNLEHIANPIKALKAWKRVSKHGGHLILVIPHYLSTFDHLRPLTSIEHMVNDYENNVGENDLTHLQEILDLHDLSRDHESGSKDEFAQRSTRNAEFRCLHHHVFNENNSADLLAIAGYEVLEVQMGEPCHIALLARA